MAPMPIRSLTPLAGLVACAAILACTSATAAARSATAALRVEGPNGALESGTSYVTGTERIKKATSKQCKPHAGRFRIPGPTALGIVNSAANAKRRLRPVRVRNDSFGFFMCTIGGIVGTPPPAPFSGWLYRVNHVSPSQSADTFRLHGGDRVLWAFTDFGPAGTNTGDELSLRGVPAGDADGTFEVHVVGFDFTGAMHDVAGATIAGASGAPTDANGRTIVTLATGQHVLFAEHGSDISSGRLDVCVNVDLSRCPEAHGRRIIGRPRADRIRGTRGWDRIRSRAGDDVVNIRLGGRDRVNCGHGRDRVLLGPGDHDDAIASNCERRVRG